MRNLTLALVVLLAACNTTKRAQKLEQKSNQMFALHEQLKMRQTFWEGVNKDSANAYMYAAFKSLTKAGDYLYKAKCLENPKISKSAKPVFLEFKKLN